MKFTTEPKDRNKKIVDSLKSLGFGPFDGSECSLGGCHIDDKHYILFTDGLIIYSNFWDHNSELATVKRRWNYWEFDEIGLQELSDLMENDDYCKHSFVSHCDECDYGWLEYECPACKKQLVDYDAWYLRDDLYSNKVESFTCHSCKSMLKIKWDNDLELVIAKAGF